MSNPTNVPFPPGGTQLTTGVGTLTGAQVPIPNAINVQNGVPYTGSQGTATPMSFKAYDTANGNTSGSPIASVSVPNGYTPVVLNAAFTNGLYIVQATPSSINFSFT